MIFSCIIGGIWLTAITAWTVWTQLRHRGMTADEALEVASTVEELERMWNR